MLKKILGSSIVVFLFVFVLVPQVHADDDQPALDVGPETSTAVAIIPSDSPRFDPAADFETVQHALLAGFNDYKTLLKLEFGVKYLALGIKNSWSGGSRGDIVFGLYLELRTRALESIPQWRKLADKVQNDQYRRTVNDALDRLKSDLQAINYKSSNEKVWRNAYQRVNGAIDSYHDQMKELVGFAKRDAFTEMSPDFISALQRLEPLLSAKVAGILAEREERLRDLTVRLAEAEASLASIEQDAEAKIGAAQARLTTLTGQVAEREALLEQVGQAMSHVMAPLQQISAVLSTGDVSLHLPKFAHNPLLDGFFSSYNIAVGGLIRDHIAEILQLYPEATPNVDVQMDVTDVKPVTSGGLFTKKTTIGFSGTLRIQVTLTSSLQSRSLPPMELRFTDSSGQLSRSFTKRLEHYFQRTVATNTKSLVRAAKNLSERKVLAEMDRCADSLRQVDLNGLFRRPLDSF